MKNTNKTAKVQLERERKQRAAYMEKQISAALAWTKKEFAKYRKDGLSNEDIATDSVLAHSILAHVGRTWNIGAQRAVEQKFKLKIAQPDDEPAEEDFDEDGEELA